jgi:hypothetical protein
MAVSGDFRWPPLGRNRWPLTRDRRVIQHEIASHHAIRHVLITRALDPTRRPMPARTRTATTPPSSTARTPADHARRPGAHGISRRQVQFAHRVEHRPHRAVLRHPITHRRRHQKHLLTVKPDEPRTHAHRITAPTGRPPPFPDSLDDESAAAATKCRVRLGDSVGVSMASELCRRRVLKELDVVVDRGGASESDSAAADRALPTLKVLRVRRQAR